jgi:hypothetical protein
MIDKFEQFSHVKHDHQLIFANAMFFKKSEVLGFSHSGAGGAFSRC